MSRAIGALIGLSVNMIHVLICNRVCLRVLGLTRGETLWVESELLYQVSKSSIHWFSLSKGSHSIPKSYTIH